MKTSLTVQQSTKKRLSRYGKIGSSWDSVIKDLLNHVEKCDVWWFDRS